MNSSSTIVRPYQGEPDLQQIVELFDDCARFDNLESSIPILQLQLPNCDFDLDRNLRLWENESGQLIGFGKLWIREPNVDNVTTSLMAFYVRPSARGEGLERQIITWAETRMSEVGSERQGQLKLTVGSRSTQTDRLAIFQAAGFVENRRLQYFCRSLNAPISVPQLPDDFTIRCVDADRDAQTWVEFRNRCFIDHWNYQPRTLADYQHRLESTDYVPELDLVIVDAEGNLASIGYCTINRSHNERLGITEGWVQSLATAPDFRRQGLAKAMLLHILHRLKTLNIDRAKLLFDSENHLGVGKLYESVGFEDLHSQIVYCKDL